MIDDRNLFVMGRGYGITNLIVLDRAGRTIWSGAINVSPPDASQVSLFRGSRVANMACSPRCERTPMPGEDQRDYKDFEPAYAGYNDRASDTASKSVKGQALPAAPGSAAGGEGR
jgi:hypothetical protein